MKIRFITKKQEQREAEQKRSRQIARCELLKLAGRLLMVAHDARDYLQASSHQPDIGGRDDLLANLNSLLNRKEQ